MQLPPLRQRRCDIPLLVEHIRRRLNAETGKDIEAVDERALRILMAHDFPGNIRELENILQHAFVMCKETVIQPAHLPRELARQAREEPAEPSTLKELEKRAIRDALTCTDGNRAAAARQLGIDPSTLYRKMKRYGI